MFKKFFAPFLLLVTPLIFAPFTINFFSTNKNMFVVLIGLILLSITAFKHLTTKKHSHLSSFFTISLGIFLSAIMLNIFLTPEARIEGLVNKGVLLLVLPVISYLIASVPNSLKNLEWALIALISGGTILALHGILQLVLLADLAALPVWMSGFSFTPAGSILALLSIISFSFIATISWAFTEKELIKKTTLFTTAGIQLAALVAYGLMMIQNKIAIQLLPLQAGWSLTLDALKSIRELLFGIGLANFPVLFTQLKPAFLAQTNLWNVVFQNNSNEIFHLLATTGIIGLGSFILVIIATIKASSKLANTPLNLALRLTTYSVILSFFLTPASVISYTFFFVLAALITASSSTSHQEISLKGYTNFVTASALGLVIIGTGYFTSRAYAAEVFMRQSQLAFAQNDADAVYAAHIKAVQYMPKMTDYRISLSQINLTLASSISQSQAAASTAGEAVELTDQQREQVSTLLQRAIEQGQVATQLRPSLYSTWQNLGGIYRNLINVAQGAEDLSLQHFGQAIAQDPANPILRVEYGGLFYQLSQMVQDKETQINLLDQSIQQFQTAIKLRPSYANAYYNLANSLDKKGSYRLAYQALSQAIANIDPESTDYQKAQQELLVLEDKLPKDPQPQTDQAVTTQTTQSNLQQPSPLPSPLPGGLIELPTATESADTVTNPDLEPTEPATEPQAVEPTPVTESDPPITP